MILSKHNQPQRISLLCCSSGCYNSCPAAKQHLKLMI